MKATAVFLLVSFLITTSAFSQFDEGKAALDQGDVAKAIELLRDAAKRDKKNPQTHLWLGVALLNADSTDQAVSSFVQARELDPNNAQIYSYLGDVYAKQKIWVAAVDQYKHSTELDSTTPGLWMKLAGAHKKTRKYTDAANAYGRVIALDSMNVAALNELGSIFIRGRVYANAVPILARLYALQRDSIPVAVNYVKALFETKNYVTLIPIAEDILKRDPSQEEVQSMLATAYEKTRRWAELIKQYENTNPESLSVDVLRSLGRAYRDQLLFDKAAVVYNVAMRKDTGNCDLHYELGVTNMRLKKYADAIAQFDQKIACDTSAGYRFACGLNAGMCYMQLKEYEKAAGYIKDAIAFRPENISALHTLAQNYAQMKNKDSEAKAAYLKVIELATVATSNGNAEENAGKYDVQLQEANRMVGLYLMLETKWVPALEYLKKSLALNPKDCTTLLLLGQASQNHNLKDDAKKYYCRVLDHCPKGKEAKDAEKGLEALGMKCRG